MRENRTYGSEGGEVLTHFSDPIRGTAMHASALPQGHAAVARGGTATHAAVRWLERDHAPPLLYAGSHARNTSCTAATTTAAGWLASTTR